MIFLIGYVVAIPFILIKMSLSQGEELLGIESLISALTFVLFFSLFILLLFSVIVILSRIGITWILFKVMLGQGDIVDDDLLNGWFNGHQFFLFKRAILSSYWSIISLSHLLFLVSVDNLSLLSIIGIIHIEMISNHLSLFC